MAAVIMPRLGATMTEGTVAEWYVDHGARVTVGTPLFVLETDKVETDVESAEDGVLQVIVAAGTTVAVGTTVAEIV